MVADGHPTPAFSLGIAVQALAAGGKAQGKAGVLTATGTRVWRALFLTGALLVVLLFVVCCLLLVVVVTNPVLPAPPQGLRLGAFGRTAGRVFLLL